MDTATSYLGLRLPHPFMAGASPYGHHLETIRRLEDGGCAAVVLHSLFEEQLTALGGGRIRHMDPADAAFAGIVARFPEGEEYPLGPDAYAEHIQRVKQAVRIPVIASLNGTSAESWLRFARIMEQAGADALELNLYEVITDLHAPAAAVENQLVGIVREVKRIVTIPVAVKVSPHFTSFANMAWQLDAVGADGLVLFNRFYEADINVHTLKTEAHVELSSSSELLLRLHWAAILFGRVRPSLAITGGVHTPEDGIKALLAGADAVQMVSALLRHGATYIQKMLRGLEDWMASHEFVSVDEMRGQASLHRMLDPASVERAGYIRTLQSWGPPVRDT